MDFVVVAVGDGLIVECITHDVEQFPVRFREILPQLRAELECLAPVVWIFWCTGIGANELYAVSDLGFLDFV